MTHVDPTSCSDGRQRIDSLFVFVFIAFVLLFGSVGREMVYGCIGFCHESQISVLRFMRKSLNFLYI